MCKKHAFVTLLAIISLTIVFCVVAYATGESNGTELMIEVYLNNSGEEYLENIELDDGSLVKDHTYSVQQLSLPRAGSISTYFDDVLWITRDGVISLSLNPKEQVRVNIDFCEWGWDALSDSSSPVRNSSYWPTNAQKEQTFYWQYICHYEYAKRKATWNIEPSSLASSYLDVVTSGCNP